MGLARKLFDENVEEHFICGLCNQVLLSPVTAGCSHIFCQACVSRKLNSKVSKQLCPLCSARLTDKICDTTIAFKLELLNLTIQCSHKCGAKFALADLPDHVEICPNAPVDCEFKSAGCQKKVKRCDAKKHVEECDFRNVECEACGFKTIYLELFTHQSRVKCLEKKLKQQIIRERKAAFQEVSRHRERLFRESVKLDHMQRQALLNHLKSRTYPNRILNRDHPESESQSEHEPVGGFFLTQELMERHNTESKARTDRDLNNYVAFAPHSSRQGLALQVCSKCKRKFRLDTNNPNSCRWHAGTCCTCGRLNYQPGCVTGFHEA